MPEREVLSREVGGYAAEVFFFCHGFTPSLGCRACSNESGEADTDTLALALAMAAAAAAAVASASLCLFARTRASSTREAEGVAARSLQSLAVSAVNQGWKAPACIDCN